MARQIENITFRKLMDVAKKAKMPLEDEEAKRIVETLRNPV